MASLLQNTQLSIPDLLSESRPQSLSVLSSSQQPSEISIDALSRPKRREVPSLLDAQGMVEEAEGRSRKKLCEDIGQPTAVPEDLLPSSQHDLSKLKTVASPSRRCKMIDRMKRKHDLPSPSQASIAASGRPVTRTSPQALRVYGRIHRLPLSVVHAITPTPISTVLTSSREVVGIDPQRSLSQSLSSAVVTNSSSAPHGSAVRQVLCSNPQPHPPSVSHSAAMASYSPADSPAAARAEAIPLSPSAGASRNSAPPIVHTPVNSGPSVAGRSKQTTEETPVHSRPSTILDISVASRSSDFYYPDGNVIVRVQDTYFRLLRSRLTRHCKYFEVLFKDDASPSLQARESVDGCPVYTIRELALPGFLTFLTYLELPMENPLQSLSTDVAISLLRTSAVLKCTLLSNLAKRQLIHEWSPNIPPSDANAPRPYHDALTILPIARELHNHDAIKLALYELLASNAFWADITSAQRKDVGITDADLIRLLQARIALQGNWRAQVLTPPKPCSTPDCPGSNDAVRGTAWSGEFAQYTILETWDPFRNIDVFKDRVKHMKGRWCDVCIGDRVCSWDEVRLVWWKDLGEQFAS